MLITDAESSLRASLETAGLSVGSDASASLAMMAEWYVRERASDAEALDHDGDMLLYQWGTNRQEGGAFEISLTRQFISSNDDEDEGISQLSLTYRYAAALGLDDLGSGAEWCARPDDVAVLRRFIAAHPTADVMLTTTPSETVVRQETV